MMELDDLVLNDLRSTQKAVTRIVSVGVFFILFCHFYVIEPYFRYKSRELAAVQTISRVEQKVEHINADVAEIKRISDEMTRRLKGMEKEIDVFPDRLRDELPRIQAAVERNVSSPQEPRAMMQQSAPIQGFQSPGFFPDLPAGIQSFEKGVQWVFENWFAQLAERIQVELVGPLGAIPGQFGDWGASRIDEKAKTAISAIRAHINDIDPGFWHHYGGVGGKMDVARQLKENFRTSFQPVTVEVNQIIDKADAIKAEKIKELENISRGLASVREKLTELSLRVKAIESPFGRLPLDLSDLISLFPFIIVAIILAYLIRAEKYISLYLLSRGRLKDHDTGSFQAVYGSWCLPPFKRYWGTALLASGFFLCLIVYFRSGNLMMKHSGLYAGIAGEGPFSSPVLFDVLFYAGAVVMVLAAFLLALAARRMNRELNGIPRSPG